MYVNLGNYRGYACEHLVSFDLLTRQIVTSLPSIPGAPYDIIADIKGELIKVQIKLAKKEGSKLIVDYRKSHGERKYTRNDFDILAVVDLDRKAIAYIPPNIWVGKTQITLWSELPSSANGFGKGRQPVLFDTYRHIPDLEATA